MEKPFNKNEQIQVSTKTLTSKELEKIVFSDNHFAVKDKRFLSTEEGGVFRYFRPEDIREDAYFPIVKQNDLITGLSVLYKNPFKEKVFWLMSLAVDPKYQNNHHATKLVEEIVKFTKEQKYKLELSSYVSKEAKEKLDRLFKEFGEKYNVEIISD